MTYARDVHSWIISGCLLDGFERGCQSTLWVTTALTQTLHGTLRSTYGIAQLAIHRRLWQVAFVPYGD
eukprot:29864-Eustigmatos_ZCMA.PRE.1